MKEKRFCLECGKEFTVGNSVKYCSRGCYFSGRKGYKHSEETKEKIRIANTGKDNSSRGKAISESRLQRSFTEDEINYIKENVEKYDWVTNEKVFIRHAGLNQVYGERLKTSKQEEVKLLIKKFKPVSPEKFFELRIQKWTYEEMSEFKKDVETLYWRKCMKKYSMTENLFMALVLKYSLKRSLDGGYRFSFTKPERIMNSLLEELGASFLREKYVNNNRWRVDFLIDGNKIIEVQGDYWHGNPEIYNERDLNKTQRESIIRDSEKREWLIQKEYGYLEIWENNLYNNYNECVEKIKLFIGEVNDDINGRVI